MRTTPSRTPRTPKSPYTGDRFIPNRSSIDLELSHWQLIKEKNVLGPRAENSPSRDIYDNSVAECVLQKPSSTPAKILTFALKAPSAAEATRDQVRVMYTQKQHSTVPVRTVPSAPERILDAPDLVDDYYLNLLHWSSQNILAVALGNKLYLWNANDGAITELVQANSSDIITSVQFVVGGSHIAVGMSNAEVWMDLHRFLLAFVVFLSLFSLCLPLSICLSFLCW